MGFLHFLRFFFFCRKQTTKFDDTGPINGCLVASTLSFPWCFSKRLSGDKSGRSKNEMNCSWWELKHSVFTMMSTCRLRQTDLPETINFRHPIISVPVVSFQKQFGDVPMKKQTNKQTNMNTSLEEFSKTKNISDGRKNFECDILRHHWTLIRRHTSCLVAQFDYCYLYEIQTITDFFIWANLKHQMSLPGNKQFEKTRRD